MISVRPSAPGLPRPRSLGRHAILRPRSAARLEFKLSPCRAESRRALSTQTLYQLPAHFMDTLHVSYGLPWLWAIPVAALVVRAALFPTLTLATRKAQQRRLAISPFLRAQSTVALQEAKQEAWEQMVDVLKIYEAKKRAATKAEAQRFAAGMRHTLLPSLLQFPVFVWMSSNIRDMLGTPQSLFWTMLGKADVTTAQLIADLTEGGPPWAMDLTAADPTGSMSFVVSGIMLAQLTRASMAAGDATVQNAQGKWVSAVMYVLALSIGPLFLGAPVGILYYWACSSGMALMTGAFMDKFYPLQVFKPCKIVKRPPAPEDF